MVQKRHALHLLVCLQPIRILRGSALPLLLHTNSHFFLLSHCHYLLAVCYPSVVVMSFFIFCVFLVADATLHLAVSVGRSVSPSVTFLNCDWFMHYCSCLIVRDWIAVYPALFYDALKFNQKEFTRKTKLTITYPILLWSMIVLSFQKLDFYTYVKEPIYYHQMLLSNGRNVRKLKETRF